MPLHPKGILYSSFKGLDNVTDPQSTNPSFLKKVENINIDKTGGLSKRKGYLKKDSANYSSLWASENGLGCYGTRNEDLIRLNDDYSFITLKSSVGLDKLSFDEIDNIIYYSSNNVNGIIHNGLNKEWGIDKNNLSPSLSITAGSLEEGTYQVAFTYVRDDGTESGTSRASIIELPSNSGITLSIPTSSDGSIISVRIYCSTLNGNTLYYSGSSLLGTVYTITDSYNLTNPLRTFNLDKAPLGHIVKYYKGRLYVAQDNILWYSEPFQYNYFKLDSNYIEFAEKIKEVMPVEDGIWIGSDSLYYLSGSSPDDFKRSLKEHIKIIEGTSTKVSGSYIHMDNTPVGYKWIVSSDLGIFILFNQGLVINLTSTSVELKSSDSGTSLFLQDGGLNQYLSILKTNQNPNNSVVGDLVESTIVRNGIIIT